MKALSFSISLFFILTACSSSSDSGSSLDPRVTAWDLSCYNAVQGTCASYKMVTPGPGACTGVGQQVSACPSLNCVVGCTITDAAGNKIETTFYGTNFGTIGQISSTCTSENGVVTPCL
jgi:hypothetical protein